MSLMVAGSNLARLAIVFILLSTLPLASQDPPRSWLDAPVRQWNKAGASIPKVKDTLDPEELSESCRALLRGPKNAEERAIARAGYHVFTPVVDAAQAAQGNTVVAGATNFDGMCRPDGYQDFVFINGQFAGTLSPKWMGARQDSSSVRIKWTGPTSLSVEYSRYLESDPLCCPSRISEADFEIQRLKGNPIVVLKRVKTRPSEQP